MLISMTALRVPQSLFSEIRQFGWHAINWNLFYLVPFFVVLCLPWLLAMVCAVSREQQPVAVTFAVLSAATTTCFGLLASSATRDTGAFYAVIAWFLMWPLFLLSRLAKRPAVPPA
jgi:hypothetical protein